MSWQRVTFCGNCRGETDAMGKLATGETCGDCRYEPWLVFEYFRRWVVTHRRPWWHWGGRDEGHWEYRAFCSMCSVPCSIEGKDFQPGLHFCSEACRRGWLGGPDLPLEAAA